jgi:hypothetical protein
MTMRTVTFFALISCALALGACSSEDGGSTAGNLSGGDAGEGGSAAAPEYNVSCHGDVSPRSLSLDLDLGARCIGGEPGTRCGTPCGAMDVEIRYELPAARCGSTNVFAWDGKECKSYATQTNEGAMKCRGVDCTKLFKTLDDCQRAFAQCPK